MLHECEIIVSVLGPFQQLPRASNAWTLVIRVLRVGDCPDISTAAKGFECLDRELVHARHIPHTISTAAKGFECLDHQQIGSFKVWTFISTAAKGFECLDS